MLLDFPDHFETDRLLLRAVCPGDGRAIYEAVAASLEHHAQPAGGRARAGYTREGHQHHDRRSTDGALADTLLYAKLRDVE